MKSLSAARQTKRKLKISVPNPEEIFNEIYIPLVSEAEPTNVPLLVIEGGRSSGKSRAIAQRLLLSSLKRKMRICLMRKVADTIRDSSYREIEDLVTEWGLQEHFTFNKARLEISNKVGSEFICKGLDKAEKVKSLANVDVLWIEEATELTEYDWDTVSLTIRGKTKYDLSKQIIISFNRTLGSWTEKKFFNADNSFKEKPGVYHLHTTFLDNKFLSQDDIMRFEYMKMEDPELYKKNALGLPVQLKGLIFTNWKEVDVFPEDCEEIIYGLDFGISDPTVLGRIGIKGKDIFVDELLYQRGLTNQQLRELLRELIPDKTKEIYADSEDKNRIEEIYSDGFNIHPADKQPKSVIEGIALMRSFNINITARSTNVKKDFENYKWKTDKNGNAITPETPMHAFSHGCDMVRYPVYTHLYNGIKSAMAGVEKKQEHQQEKPKPKKLSDMYFGDTVMITGRLKRSF